MFSQTVTGTLDGTGVAPSARVYVEYWGSAQGDRGTVEFWLFLDTLAGRYEYQASADLSSLTLADDGAVTYGFLGRYALETAPVGAEEGLPHDGTIALDFSFWVDGTSLYKSQLQLTESVGLTFQSTRTTFASLTRSP